MFVQEEEVCPLTLFLSVIIECCNVVFEYIILEILNVISRNMTKFLSVEHSRATETLQTCPAAHSIS